MARSKTTKQLAFASEEALVLSRRVSGYVRNGVGRIGFQWMTRRTALEIVAARAAAKRNK